MTVAPGDGCGCRLLLYRQLIGPSATSWPMSDVDHMKGLQTRPEEYERRVLAFFDAALLDGSSAGGTGA